ncbi:MAG: hypothetical protein K0Q49_1909 [Haloplasmataceae bacterium]|jgi:hypothetical protein|nr:hypothetical protein [Haloplasmataceae bacterium]
MKKQNGLKKIRLSFLAFMTLFILNFGVVLDITVTQRMWLIMDIYVFLLSMFILIRIKLPSRKQILISLLFGVLVFVSYWGLSIFSSIKGSLLTILCSLAVFSIFNRYDHNVLKLFRTKIVSSVLLSIFIGLFVGIVLGVINFYFMSISATPNLRISIKFFLISLSPAIYEEITMRTFMYAYCLYLLNGEINTKIERFACWFMMIIPHVLIHTPDSFINFGLISGVMTVLLYVVLFGLPFAFLQKKRDIVSAMIAHGVVDVIRFCLFGLPL